MTLNDLFHSFASVSQQTNIFDHLSSNLKLSWKNCGPTADPIQLQNLNISPDPIHLLGNITVDSSATLSQPIPTDVQVIVNVDRKVGPFFVKVPCVNNFGSCTYTNACELWSQVCPKKFAQKYGVPCQCPIPANTYSVSNISFLIGKKVPPELLGDYRATVDIRSDDEHLGCIHVELTVRN